jgi:hypothetical protein
MPAISVSGSIPLTSPPSEKFQKTSIGASESEGELKKQRRCRRFTELKRNVNGARSPHRIRQLPEAALDPLIGKQQEILR